VEKVRYLKEENKELCAQVLELKESAARNTSDMLGCAQVVHFEMDLRTHCRINALVTERIFPVKKFLSGQKELNNFSGNSSLGMLMMTMLKIDKPD
jgi:K+/H+ antiporter YhaU regulatory subunit KhtT